LFVWIFIAQAFNIKRLRQKFYTALLFI